jgi:transposase-like protein
MGQEKKKDLVVEEYLRGGVTLRELEARYRVARSTIHKWVKEFESGYTVEQLKTSMELRKKRSELPVEVRELQRQLEEARLQNELLNTMIDIAEDQLGVDIRKKRGAKRSE